jgi:hypothetical protein
VYLGLPKSSAMSLPPASADLVILRSLPVDDEDFDDGIVWVTLGHDHERPLGRNQRLGVRDALDYLLLTFGSPAGYALGVRCSSSERLTVSVTAKV